MRDVCVTCAGVSFQSDAASARSDERSVADARSVAGRSAVDTHSHAGDTARDTGTSLVFSLTAGTQIVAQRRSAHA